MNFYGVRTCLEVLGIFIYAPSMLPEAAPHFTLQRSSHNLSEDKQEFPRDNITNGLNNIAEDDELRALCERLERRLEDNKVPVCSIARGDDTNPDTVLHLASQVRMTSLDVGAYLKIPDDKQQEHKNAGCDMRDPLPLAMQWGAAGARLAPITHADYANRPLVHNASTAAVGADDGGVEDDPIDNAYKALAGPRLHAVVPMCRPGQLTYFPHSPQQLEHDNCAHGLIDLTNGASDTIDLGSVRCGGFVGGARGGHGRAASAAALLLRAAEEIIPFLTTYVQLPGTLVITALYTLLAGFLGFVAPIFASLQADPATFAMRFQGLWRPCTATGHDDCWGADAARGDDGGGCDGDGDSLQEGWKICSLQARFSSIREQWDLHDGADGTGWQGASIPNSVGGSEPGKCSSSTGPRRTSTTKWGAVISCDAPLPPPHVLPCARRRAAATTADNDEDGFADKGDDDDDEGFPTDDAQLALIKHEEVEAEVVRGCHADDKPRAGSVIAEASVAVDGGAEVAAALAASSLTDPAKPQVDEFRLRPCAVSGVCVDEPAAAAAGAGPVGTDNSKSLLRAIDVVIHDDDNRHPEEEIEGHDGGLWDYAVADDDGGLDDNEVDNDDGGLWDSVGGASAAEAAAAVRLRLQLRRMSSRRRQNRANSPGEIWRRAPGEGRWVEML